MDVKVGDVVEILSMLGEPHYQGRQGIITHINSAGCIYGTWGDHSILPEVDEFRIIETA